MKAGELDGFAIAAMDDIGIDISKFCRPHVRGSRGFEFRPHHHALAGSPPQGARIHAHAGGGSALLADHRPDRGAGSREQMLDAYRAVRDGLKNRITTSFWRAEFHKPAARIPPPPAGPAASAGISRFVKYMAIPSRERRGNAGSELQAIGDGRDEDRRRQSLERASRAA